MPASTTGIELDVSHIPGADNIIADDLSRWDFSTPIPHDFQTSERIHLSLNQLCRCSPQPTLHPPDSKLLLETPTSRYDVICWNGSHFLFGRVCAITIIPDSCSLGC